MKESGRKVVENVRERKKEKKKKNMIFSPLYDTLYIMRET